MPVKAAPAKAPAKKVVAKPAPAKVPAKVAPAKAPAKKAVAKPAPAKAPVKAAPAKTPAKKVVAKPVPAKSAPEKAPAKAAPAKPVAKVAVKPAPAKAVPKEVAPKAPVKSPNKTSGKKTPVKTVITSTLNSLPKKSDVYKTSTFSSPTLRNDSNKVIAHRKTSELKRKNNDENSVKKFEPELTRSILDMNPTNEGPSYRYSDDDLQEFREIIQRKLETAKAELQYLQGVIMRKDEGGTEDTENKYQNIEDGGASMEREQFNQLASRQITFINHLEQALVRIENKTYGICRDTGKLIDKARLRAVPHATLSIEAKNAKKN